MMASSDWARAKSSSPLAFFTASSAAALAALAFSSSRSLPRTAVSDSTVTQSGNFKNAAGHEDELLAAVRHLDAHRARLDAGDQRRVARIDAQFTRFEIGRA